MASPESPPAILIHNRYRILGTIGSGGFGTVCLATDTHHPAPVAIKLSPAPVAIKLSPAPSAPLALEARLLALLHGPGIPPLRAFAPAGPYAALVMDLLGPSLHHLLGPRRRFSLKTTLLLADQLLARLEHIHARGVLHGDIKPHNILMGVGTRGGIAHLADFGLAREHPGRNDPAPLERQAFYGTPRFASIAAHLSYEQSWKDDIESLAYVLIYLATGSLPWSRLAHSPGRDLIGETKVALSPDLVAHGLPREFADHLAYARALKPGERVDYRALRHMYAGLLERRGFRNDGVFDWTGQLEDSG